LENILSGVKVLDVSHYIAGPYCTKMLADYGAEVIKVERPTTGDGARNMAPFHKDEPHPEKSGLFLYLNTSKKGITLNLKSTEGKQIFTELVKECDIVVENFHPRVMPSLGLDYESLEKINPQIIMTSISNFGQTGPYRDFKMTEIVADAMGGWSTIIGHPDREPLKPGGNQAQFVAGLFGSIAAVSAFYGKEVLGTGQHVDISIMEAVLYIQMNLTSTYSYYDVIVKRYGNRVLPFPSGILPCADGYIGAITVTAEKWPVLCNWMGMPELIDDSRFATPGDRANNIDELEAIMITWLTKHDQEYLFHEGQKRKLPFGIPSSAKILLESPHLNRRGYFTEVDHPLTGSLKYPGAQVKIGELPYRLKRAPLLGEHNEDVYCKKLGYSKSDLARLRERGVI